LFGVDELLVRSGRTVPEENDAMLGEFILKKIKAINEIQSRIKNP